MHQSGRHTSRANVTLYLESYFEECGSISADKKHRLLGIDDKDAGTITVDGKEICHVKREHLPQGYDTMLSDEGVNISKGQRQLITIARALLSDSPMLILDEATSNVDSRTEIKIQQAMNELMKGRTCFVIAHRLSTIQNADCILVLQKGRITEQGSHEELLQKGGFYSTLYNAQHL